MSTGFRQLILPVYRDGKRHTATKVNTITVMPENNTSFRQSATRKPTPPIGVDVPRRSKEGPQLAVDPIA